jgi:hypothetical protein
MKTNLKEIKYDAICSGCSAKLSAGSQAFMRKIGGATWGFLCSTCVAKIDEQGSSSWWNPQKAVEALVYYNCDLGDELDHHDWDILRLFGIEPFGM